MGRAAG